jgi:DNA helicase-2/ATP-dependent DNA helicase PcrA
LPLGDNIDSTLKAAIMKTWNAMKIKSGTSDEFERLRNEFLANLVDLPVRLWEIIEEEEYQPPEPIRGAPFESLSYTDINSFDNCPLQFYFGKILRTPSPATPGMMFGSAVHNVLEEAGKAIIAGEEITLETLVTNFEERWKRIRLSDPDRKERLRQRAPELFGNFMAGQAVLNGKPKEVEKRFEFKAADIKITGKIDRIDITPDGYEIMDYKTGKLDERKLKSDFQLPIYSLACKELYGEFPSRVTYLFLTQPDPYSQEQSSGDLEKIKDDVTEKIEQIKNSDYTATPDSYKCGGCGYNRICPAKV